MGKPAARMGDMTAHGGSIVVGAPTVLIGGQPAARVGDMHVCPMVTPGTPPIPHVGGPILPPGAMTVLICGQPAACVGDMATCVGPPDSIIPPGCPTVLIGPGGGGGSGGGGAGSGGGSAKADSDTGPGGGGGETSEAEEKEAHFLNVKFTDKGGYPITGIGYVHKHPDGKVAEGILAGQIKNEMVSSGNHEIALQAIIKAQWSADSARDGETVKIQIETAGFEDGTAAVIEVWERDFLRADMINKRIEGITLDSNNAEAEWEYVYRTEKAEDAHESSAGYSAPNFYFTVKIGSLTARSGMLVYKDYIEIELRDDEDKPVAEEEYVMHISNGDTRRGKLDRNGYAKEEKLPPGRCRIEFPNRQRGVRSE